MKKAIVALLLASAAVAHGQGMVQFRNYWAATTPSINAPVYLDAVGGMRLNASNPLWRAALVGGPAETGIPWGWGRQGNLQMMYYPNNTTITWVNFRSGTNPPAADGYVNVGSSASRVVPGVDWGGLAMVQMVVWEGLANTIDDVWQLNYPRPPSGHYYVGFSNPLILQLPSSSTDPNLTYLWGLQPFAINWVPEPSSFALLSLSVALLISRQAVQKRKTRQEF
jgi:hypothetical protein